MFILTSPVVIISTMIFGTSEHALSEDKVVYLMQRYELQRFSRPTGMNHLL